MGRQLTVLWPSLMALAYRLVIEIERWIFITLTLLRWYFLFILEKRRARLRLHTAICYTAHLFSRLHLTARAV